MGYAQRQPMCTSDQLHPREQPAWEATINRPTIRDVAATAGVSRGTVSRVLNGGRYVSPAALAAVEKAIRQTGYVANHSARSLARRRTDCVAFILSEPQEKLFEDPNFDVLLRSATRALAEHDKTLVMIIAGDQDDHERVLRYLRAGHVDGVLLISAHGGDPLLKHLPEAQLPVVCCGRPPANTEFVPYVGSDNYGGARRMTEHLINLGRKRIATITGPLDISSGIDRLAGFRAVMAEHGRPERMVTADDYSYRSGEAAMAELLESDPDVDAVFVASDLLATGALATLRRHGRHVPDDVAVGGFDDSRVAVSTEPALTTVRQPVELIAKEMTRLLVDHILGDEPPSVVLETTLVRRESA